VYLSDKFFPESSSGSIVQLSSLGVKLHLIIGL